jgi:hypothetical protein
MLGIKLRSFVIDENTKLSSQPRVEFPDGAGICHV